MTTPPYESDKGPDKAWLEQAQFYEQPFTVFKDGETYRLTVEKIEE